jgi:uncharacterized iron-regulated protein
MHFLILCACAVVLSLHVGAAQAAGACLTPGAWATPTETGVQSLRPDAVIGELAHKRVVLLGERHDNAEHHRWQLHTLAALHALQPRLVLGMEMFPRRVQNVLDEWSAGSLTEEELLARTDWSQVWGHDAELYLPILHFARMHRIPLLALNVERALVRRVATQGWDAVPEAQREGVERPAPAAADYQAVLYESYLAHLPEAERGRHQQAGPDYTDPAFQRFVLGMQVWDRAMAQAISERLALDDGVLVVALIGSGHLLYGYGTPDQLRELGVRDTAVLLPWDADQDCHELRPGLADLVFGVQAPPSAPRAQRPRLGITLDQADEGVTIREVVRGSIAETAGARAGDVITVLAGTPVKETQDVIAAVQRQAPGTWLPMTIRRGDASLELVARFPPAQ